MRSRERGNVAWSGVEGIDSGRSWSEPYMRNSVSEGQLEDQYDRAGFVELVENYLKSYIRERILNF